MPSVAVKKSEPFDRVKPRGFPEGRPGFRSATCTVPVSVPSDFHNSIPLIPSLASKKSCQRDRIAERAIDEIDILTMTVLALRLLFRIHAIHAVISKIQPPKATNALDSRASRMDVFDQRRAG
jgi:hypothetical protein